MEAEAARRSEAWVWWSLIGIELWLGTAASSLLALLSAQCGTDEDPWRLCPEPEITTGTRQTSEMVQRHTTLQVLDENPGNLLLHIAVPSACSRHQEHCASPAHAVTVAWRLSELGTSGSSTGARVCEAREHGFSQWNVPPDPGAPNSSPVLPPCAAAFVGEWMQQRTENYIEYLREVLGLSWPMRKIAEQIPLSPTIALLDGQLLCTTHCPGAITVQETMVAGDSLFFEPNQDVTYKVNAFWEGDTFVACRHSPAVYGAKNDVTRERASFGNVF